MEFYFNFDKPTSSYMVGICLTLRKQAKRTWDTPVETTQMEDRHRRARGPVHVISVTCINQAACLWTVSDVNIKLKFAIE